MDQAERAAKRTDRCMRGCMPFQSEKAELHPRTIQKIESGSINLLVTTLDRLRVALGTTWSEFLVLLRWLD